MRWMAPELLEYTPDGEGANQHEIDFAGKKKVDVWAFGMTIYVSSFSKRRLRKAVIDLLYRSS